MTNIIISYFTLGCIVGVVCMAYTTIKEHCESRVFRTRDKHAFDITGTIVSTVKRVALFCAGIILIILLCILWPVTTVYMLWVTYSNE